MRLFKLQLKRLFKSKLLLILAVVFVLASMAFMTSRTIGASSPLMLLGQSLLISYPLAILCMFISFEYFIKAKLNNAYEYLVSLKSAVPFYYISGIFVLASLLMVYTVIIFLMNVIFYLVNSVVYSEYILHLFLNILLNLFLIPLTFILIGAALTFINKRIVGYALIIAVCLLTSPILTIIGTRLHSDAGVNIFKFVDLLDFMPPLLNWTPVYSFGYSILPYRFFQVGFFVFLALIFITQQIYKNYSLRGKAVPLFCLFLSVLTLSFYLQPASVVTLGLNPLNGCHADQFYYGELNESVENKAGDFHVSGYKLNLSIKNEMKAVAEIAVSRTNLSDLEFTLYHGYKISKITNENGERLQFLQKSDYITIQSDKPLEKVIMYYHGSAPRFFANRQGVSLPGYLPFYPQKGFRNIYNNDAFGFDKFTQTEQYIFDVYVDAKREVYCSLPKTGRNTFSGTSNSLTLVSGLYDTYNYNNIEIIYPYMLINKDFTISNLLSELDGLLDNCLNEKEINKIICIANMNNISYFERMSLYNDHIIVTDFGGLEDKYEDQRLSGDKRLLYEYIKLYRDKNQIYDLRLNSAKSETSEEARLILLLDGKIKLLGETPVIEKTTEYLNSEDNRSAFEFLEGLR